MNPDKAIQLGNDLCCLAASITEIGEELKAMYDFDSQDHEEDQTQPVQESRTEIPTLERVRGYLADCVSLGHQCAVQEIIAKRGVQRLSDIDPSEYPGIMTEAEALI